MSQQTTVMLLSCKHHVQQSSRNKFESNVCLLKKDSMLFTAASLNAALLICVRKSLHATLRQSVVQNLYCESMDNIYVHARDTSDKAANNLHCFTPHHCSLCLQAM